MSTEATAEQARALAQTASDMLGVLWDSRTAGDVGDEDFVLQAVTVLVAVLDQAAMLADAALATILDRPAAGVVPDDPSDRLTLAMHTILRRAATEPAYDGAQSVRLVAGAEVLTAVQQTTGQALREHKVPGWRRVSRDSCCGDCRRLSAKPFIPANVRMWAHPGCSCLQQPAEDPSNPTTIHDSRITNPGGEL